MTDKNIYDAVHILQDLLDTKKLTSRQRLFVNYILHGDKQPHGWKGFKKLARSAKESDLDEIKKQLEHEIKETKAADKTYKAGLQEALATISYVVAQRKAHKKINLEAAQTLECIYQQSQENYNATLILPIKQGLDWRLGTSKGECFGYVAEWIRGVITNKKPFGIDPKNPPPFKLIKRDSPAGRRYPDLNHLAILTEDMANFQFDKSSLEDGRINKAEVSVLNFYGHTTEIADHLIELANQYPQKAFCVGLTGMKIFMGNRD